MAAGSPERACARASAVPHAVANEASAGAMRSVVGMIFMSRYWRT